MGQIVGKISDIYRCNLRAIQTGGTKANTVLAADEVWLVDSTNSLSSAFSGDCDCYIIGNGSTAASSLTLHKMKDKLLDEQLNGYDGIVITEQQQTDVAGYYNLNNSTLTASRLSSETAHCAKISAVAGDVFKIYGKGADTGTAVALWATADSNRLRKRRAEAGLNCRTTPAVITLESGEAYLYVNLANYDSTTDKILKVIETPSHVDGLVDRVEELEANEVEVVDGLDSTSATKALSANQGRVLDEKVGLLTADINNLEKSVPEKLWEEVDVQNLTSIPMVINRTATDGVYKWASNRSSSQQIATYRHSRVKCGSGDKFLVFANSNNDFYYAWLTSFDTTYDSAAPLVADTTPMSVSSGGYAYIEAPDGAEFLYFRRSLTGINNTELLPSKLLRMGINTTEVATPVTVYNMTINSTGNIVDGAGSDCIIRFIKIKSGEKVKIFTDYTANVNTGRPITLAFSQKLPEIGGSCTIVDHSENYAAHIIYNDFYVAPFDGYFCVSHQYGTLFYTNYAFYKVLVGDDSAKPLRDEKIVVFGDSILQFKYDYLKRGFVEYLAEYSGATVIRGAIGGSRLVPRASSDSRNALDISNLIHSWVNNSWTEVDAALVDYPEYSDIITGLKAVRPTEVTMVVLDGGGNDLSDSNLTFGDETAADIFNATPTNTTLYGAVNYVMRDLFTANPYLKVFWVGGMVNFAGSGVSDRTEENWVDNRTCTVEGNTYTLLEYRAKIAKQVQKWKVPCISFTELCINPVNFDKFFITNDNTHPYKGFDRMARIVASQIVARLM